MAVRVRPASLKADREQLIEAFALWLTPLSTGERFDWLYRRNPAGDALAWILCAEQGVVGACAAFPRRVFVKGAMARGYVLGDFCIKPAYRTLGPAIELQRACLAEMNAEGTVWFDFPSTSMLAVYARLGIRPDESVTRFAKLLRADRKIAELVRSAGVARGLSAVANPWLALRDRGRSEAKSYTVDFHRGACGEEFTALAEAASAGYGICSWRSADYLNWRYLAHALQHYEILTARRGGHLLAYAIFTSSNQDANLADWFGADDCALTALVVQLTAHLRTQGVATLSAALQPSHPRARLLRDLGFRPRETSTVVTSMPPALTGEAGAPGPGWFLSYGDRDS
jgi:hypothetical protein